MGVINEWDALHAPVSTRVWVTFLPLRVGADSKSVSGRLNANKSSLVCTSKEILFV